MGQKKVSETSTLMLACPFYKAHPQDPDLSWTCCGRGWPTVHRVKYAPYPSLLSTVPWGYP
jgi:hypothetical protein